MQIPEFNILAASLRKLTVTARHATDASFKLDGTLSLTVSGDTLTGLALDITMQHASLKSPVRFNGNVSGKPRTRADAEYDQVTLNGTFSSEWFDATVTNAVATTPRTGNWTITFASTSVNTKLSKPASLTASGIVVELEPPDEAAGYFDPTPAKIQVASATLRASGHTLTITNGTATAVRTKDAWGDVRTLPTSLKGQLSYQGPKLTVSGTADCVWQNPVLEPLQLPTPVADFPKATITVSGRVQPTVGQPMEASLQLTFDNTVVQGTVKVSLQISGLLALGERVSGSVTAALPVLDGMVQDDGTLTAGFTHSSGMVVAMSVQAHQDATGTIKSAAGTVVGQIGPGSQLGLPDLGSTAIVKYSDGSFETLGSLLK